MDMIQLDNVFNYIPKSIRDQIADDDQVRSWALQAARSLNFKHFQYIRDVAFYAVTNHKAVLDPDLKKILKVQGLQRSAINQSEVDILYGCCDTDESFDLYPDDMSFSEACPIYHRLYVSSTFSQNCWGPVGRVQALTENYFCNTEYSGCDDVYSYDNNTGIMQTSFASGVIAVTGYYNFQDVDGNFMIPQEPFTLWRYMASYVKARFYEDQQAMGRQNVATAYQMARDEETKYRNNVRATWTLMSLNSKNIEAIMSSRFLRNPQVLMEYMANLNGAY